MDVTPSTNGTAKGKKKMSHQDRLILARAVKAARHKIQHSPLTVELSREQAAFLFDLLDGDKTKEACDIRRQLIESAFFFMKS